MLGQWSRRRFPDVEFCKARPRAKPDGLLIVPSPNGHQVQHCGKGFACAICLSRSRTYAGLVLTSCTGIPKLIRQAHSTHRLWGSLESVQNQRLYYCAVCGSFGRAKILKL
eukprot:8957534-Pyramimonas_sp.AAC.1